MAAALDKKIRDNLRDPRNSMFSGDNMTQLRLVVLCKSYGLPHRSYDLILIQLQSSFVSYPGSRYRFSHASSPHMDVSSPGP